MTLKSTQYQPEVCVFSRCIFARVHTEYSRMLLKSKKYHGKFRKENLLSFPKYELSAFMLHKVIDITKRIHRFLVFFKHWILKLAI